MDHNCERHTFESADGLCRSCQGSFCGECLLWPWGPNKDPLCKACAISVGGIRSTARNTPRATSKKATAKRSGGLIARRRSRGAEGEEVRPETPEEAIEREAEEARRLLDAQRLPTEEESEEEPEPMPAPNIAPPGALHEERELNHRAVPDQVAGGLELTASAPDTGPNDDMPDWARPEAAGQEHAEPAPAAPSSDDATPDWAKPSAAEYPAGPTPVGLDTPPLPAHAEPVAGAMPEDAAPVEADDAPLPEPVPAAAVTADGQALFAEPITAPGDDTAPEPPRPTTATSGDAAPNVTNGAPNDTDELLRRIAELRCR